MNYKEYLNKILLSEYTYNNESWYIREKEKYNNEKPLIIDGYDNWQKSESITKYIKWLNSVKWEKDRESIEAFGNPIILKIMIKSHLDEENSSGLDCEDILKEMLNFKEAETSYSYNSGENSIKARVFTCDNINRFEYAKKQYDIKNKKTIDKIKNIIYIINNNDRTKSYETKPM